MATSVFEMESLDPIARINAIRAGFPGHDIEAVANQYHLSQKSIYQLLGASSRNGARIVKSDQSLDKNMSQILIHLLEVLEYAAEVFEDKDQAMRWLNREHGLLHAKPIDLLDTADGYELVKRELTAIDYGLPA